MLSNRFVLPVAALMVLTAVLFWAASAVEKGAARPTVTVAAHSEGGGESEGKQAPAAEGSSARESQEATAGQPPDALTLGINLEAPWVPWAVIIETAVLIVALFLFGSPVLFVVILLAIVGTILDVRELLHQMAASRAGLSFLVAVVALTRVATAAVSLGALLGRQRPVQAA